MKALGQHMIKSALITGCNRGIGLGMLKHLAANSGSDTHLFAGSRRSSPELDELAKQDNVHLLTMDISDEKSVESAVAKVTEILGGKGLNLLINNAGVIGPEIFRKVVDTKPDEMNRLYNINVSSTHHVTTSFYPLLKLSASSNSSLPMCAARGLVVNFSSNAASISQAPPFGQVMVFSYALSKCAVNMMTKFSAYEFKQDGVMCVAVHPGWVKTDMGALVGEEFGSTGDLTVEQAAQDMIDIMTRVTEEHTGLYLAKDLEKLPF